MTDPRTSDDRRSTPLPDIGQSADERTTLVGFLDHQRAVFRRKVEDLDDVQVRSRVAPSDLDLLGMVRHLTDVERWWFRGVFTAEVTDGVYESETDPDLDWHHAPDDRLVDALAAFDEEVSRAREVVTATEDLGTMSANGSGHRSYVSLRWILVHVIEEYARHCGHADYLREAIDGVTGD